MNITFEELRAIKHKLPTGSISRIATELNLSEQTVRNYFGANKFGEGEIADKHIQPGPHGGIVHLEDTSILEAARRILAEFEKSELQKEES
ncbi:MAG: DNA-binding protein [Lewinellaceae bacterium]|nr:DNA-binding protein [Phaeodactylibacter sp.]MCB0616815.1 DNA-binding protein [Phaeodactylibacter sp.]MCB9349711.1 DNA-binding protein [Lewinellaceae bacterium]